jgi:hypothetical protein
VEVEMEKKFETKLWGVKKDGEEEMTKERKALAWIAYARISIQKESLIQDPKDDYINVHDICNREIETFPIEIFYSWDEMIDKYADFYDETVSQERS